MHIGAIYCRQNLSFKAGKTTLITDFDFTFSPKAFEDKYLPHDVKCYEDIANPYFKKFSDLQKKFKDNFKIFISSGRKQDSTRDECSCIFQNFSKLDKENRPKIDGVIENNGGTFFNVNEKGAVVDLQVDEKRNEQRNIVRKQLQEKQTGQDVAKDLDAYIALKEAKEKDDLVIVSGDGTNDRSFLNIYSYVDLPKDTKIPQTIQASENLLKTMPEIKKQISELPLKIIIMEGDCSKEEYFKHLTKTFPTKYKTGKQAVKIGENPLFDNVEKSIEEYKTVNKKYANAIKKQQSSLFKKILLPCIIVVLAIGAGVSFFLLKNKKDKT